jgi:hypothetical protein
MTSTTKARPYCSDLELIVTLGTTHENLVGPETARQEIFDDTVHLLHAGTVAKIVSPASRR